MRPVWAAAVGPFSFCMSIQYLIIALLQKWAVESNGPSSRYQRVLFSRKRTSGESASVLEHLRFGFSSTFSFRDVNTVYEVKNVPHCSASDSTYVPSRKKFLAQSTLILVVCYVLLDLAESQPPAPNAKKLFSWKVIPLLTRLDEVTLEEMITRCLVTLGFWLTLYCLLTVFAKGLAVVFVALGLTDVKSWRPIFGYFSETYTLRRFWG